TAQTDLTEVRLDGKELPEFAALKKPTRKFTFDLERTLSADKQTFTFQARAQDSEPRSFTLKVEYIPLLPIVTLVSPQNLHSRPPSGRDVRLQWELNPLEDHDYKIEVRVNGLEVKNTLDRPTQRLMADCTLTPGKNSIRVVVALKGRSRTTDFAAYVQQPPVVRVRPLRAGPTLTLEVRVESPMPLTGARVSGDSMAEREVNLERTEGLRRGDNPTADFQMKEVPLVEHVTNTIYVSIRNDDGETRERIEVKGPKRMIPTPSVTISEPARDVTTGLDRYALRFSVDSLTPL